METRTEIPLLHFDKTSKQWTPIKFESELTQISDATQLTLVTYNVCFDGSNFKERGIALRKILEESDADFICLQEIIQAFHTELFNCSWTQKYYITGHAIPGYTTLILSKHPCHFYNRKFPTKMGRSLLYAELRVNDVPTVVGTIHLDSLGSSELRKEQLDVCFDEFKSYQMAILTGDLNFDWATENRNIIPEYKDVWKALYPQDPGYTMPRALNFLAYRFDRILLKKNTLCKPIAIERIGMKCIDKHANNPQIEGSESEDIVGEIIRTPSDHYGLKCLIEIKPAISEGADETHQIGEEAKHTFKSIPKVNYVWINTHLKNKENTYYLNELETLLTSYKGEIKGFDRIPDGLEYIHFMLEEFEDLTLIFDFLSLHTIVNDWKRDLKRINEVYSREASKV